ncbi:MAG TPA: hypothetical protein VE907_03165 [Gammaproteobacteria bacterium]|nr:hypothetical protein [Gammaproteobacteria bacterium]
MSGPSLRSPETDARRVGRRDAALAAKIRGNTWLLAGFAVAFYLGYIAWNFFRGPL